MVKRIFKIPPLARHLYFWVIVAMVAGVAIGHFDPGLGVNLKPLEDGFIALIRMLIAPVIFCTVVLGISGAGDMKRVGRVGLKAFLYFEIVSTFALIIGLLAGNFLAPGRGFNADPKALDPSLVADLSTKAHAQSFSHFVLGMIPHSFFDAFTGLDNLLQILLIALLFGYGMNRLGARGRRIHEFLEEVSQVFFVMVNLIMKLAPLGAGGALAFTVGKYGLGSLRPLLSLVGCFYLTCALFILFVLGPIAHFTGFNIFKFLRYIRSELFTVMATSSSESGLVSLMEKLEKLGCSRAVVGLVVPSGYSFNLDGTNIYLTLALLFVAQALNIDLSLAQQLGILGIAILTSKGASGVAGAGFITLAATLTMVPDVPVAGLALILGVDRFMSEVRALTNIIGNGVATIVISKWENELDGEVLVRELGRLGEG